jgi:hypothetical protein
MTGSFRQRIRAGNSCSPGRRSGPFLSFAIPGLPIRVESYFLRKAYDCYDVQVTVDSDRTFNRRFAGHVETGRIARAILPWVLEVERHAGAGRVSAVSAARAARPDQYEEMIFVNALGRYRDGFIS